MEGNMHINLREITMGNFEQCINLKVHESQKNFVASNSYSLSEAFADKVSNPRAIYVADMMVGFIMYDYDPVKQTGYISRLMVDSLYQQNGYGREAMEEILQRLKSIEGCKYIQTSYHRDNANAGRLYERLGFVKTGEFTNNGEVICRITI
jgi:diamine N-acetyltransferase